MKKLNLIFVILLALFNYFVSAEENERESGKGSITGHILVDIEGLAIYPTDPINGYLIASSQGNFSYAVFERQGDNKYLRSFRIVGENIDGVEETDGLEVTSFSLGPKFPEGALIVQDGFNYDGKKKKAQNFKIVSWNEISGFLKD